MISQPPRNSRSGFKFAWMCSFSLPPPSYVHKKSWKPALTASWIEFFFFFSPLLQMVKGMIISSIEWRKQQNMTSANLVHSKWPDRWNDPSIPLCRGLLFPLSGQCLEWNSADFNWSRNVILQYPHWIKSLSLTRKKVGMSLCCSIRIRDCVQSEARSHFPLSFYIHTTRVRMMCIEMG